MYMKRLIRDSKSQSFLIIFPITDKKRPRCSYHFMVNVCCFIICMKAECSL